MIVYCDDFMKCFSSKNFGQNLSRSVLVDILQEIGSGL